MRSFIILVIYFGGIMIISCQSQQNIVGEYTIVPMGKYPKVIPSTMRILLCEDSTYEYRYKSGFYSEFSSGTWSVNQGKDEISLNSYIKNIKDIPLDVTEKKQDKPVTFRFNNPLKLDTLTKWLLNINGVDYQMNGDTLKFDEGFAVDSFRLCGFLTVEDSVWRVPFPLNDTLQSEMYHTRDKNINVYIISFKPLVNYDVFYYKTMQDSITLKRKSILFNGVKLRRK